MSIESPHNTTAKSEHGTIRSYVIGFVLSLVFTVIPYYMVVIEQIVTGYALLATILGFAVIQMLIQVFFFLHLGRGPKPFYNVVFFFATIGLIIVVVGASVLIMHSLYRSMTPQEVITRVAQGENIAEIGGELTGACQGVNDNHIVTIRDGRVDPLHVEAQRCDTLTFVNEDDKKREFAFGMHNRHISYGGIYEVPVSSSRPKSITLNEIGDFDFHDHFDPPVRGSFTVLSPDEPS